MSIANAISSAISANIVASMPNPQAEFERHTIGLYYASQPSQLADHTATCKQCLNGGDCKIFKVLEKNDDFRKNIIEKLIGKKQ